MLNLKWLDTIPTTPLRIVVTVLLTIATAFRFLIWGVPAHIVKGAGPNIPDTAIIDGWGYWLLFLCVMAGIDVAQYIGRRVSDYTYAAVKAGTTQPPPAPPPPPLPPLGADPGIDKR